LAGIEKAKVNRSSNVKGMTINPGAFKFSFKVKLGFESTIGGDFVQ
jgi:hypothetical protein